MYYSSGILQRSLLLYFFIPSAKSSARNSSTMLLSHHYVTLTGYILFLILIYKNNNCNNRINYICCILNEKYFLGIICFCNHNLHFYLNSLFFFFFILRNIVTYWDQANLFLSTYFSNRFSRRHHISSSVARWHEPNIETAIKSVLQIFCICNFLSQFLGILWCRLLDFTSMSTLFSLSFLCHG